MRERVRGASRRYFDVFCLDGRGRSGTLFFQHQPISIANVFFQLLERRAWAKDTWYRQRCQIQAAGHFPARRPAQLVAGARLPVAILPILETESNSLLHRKHWWRRRESNPRPRKLAVKSLRAYPVQYLRAPHQSRQERRRPSPIDLGLLLRTEALSLSRKMTLTDRRAGSAAGAAT